MGFSFLDELFVLGKLNFRAISAVLFYFGVCTLIGCIPMIWICSVFKIGCRILKKIVIHTVLLRG